VEVDYGPRHTTALKVKQDKIKMTSTEAEDISRLQILKDAVEACWAHNLMNFTFSIYLNTKSKIH
jgi:hypothetical protein